MFPASFPPFPILLTSCPLTVKTNFPTRSHPSEANIIKGCMNKDDCVFLNNTETRPIRWARASRSKSALKTTTTRVFQATYRISPMSRPVDINVTAHAYSNGHEKNKLPYLWAIWNMFNCSVPTNNLFYCSSVPTQLTKSSGIAVSLQRWWSRDFHFG